MLKIVRRSHIDDENSEYKRFWIDIPRKALVMNDQVRKSYEDFMSPEIDHAECLRRMARTVELIHEYTKDEE